MVVSRSLLGTQVGQHLHHTVTDARRENSVTHHQPQRTNPTHIDCGHFISYDKTDNEYQKGADRVTRLHVHFECFSGEKLVPRSGSVYY